MKRGILLLFSNVFFKKKRDFLFLFVVFLLLGMLLALINPEKYSFTQYVSVIKSHQTKSHNRSAESYVATLTGKINKQYVIIAMDNKRQIPGLQKLNISAYDAGGGDTIALTATAVLRDEEKIKILFAEIFRTISDGEAHHSIKFQISSKLITSLAPVSVAKTKVIILSLLIGLFLNLIIFCIQEISSNSSILRYDA